MSESELIELLAADPPVLRAEPGGAVRIGESRINLDLIVEQHERGMTPQELVRAYDTLSLADVYSAIAFYLRHPDAVRQYMRRREKDAETLRSRVEAANPRITREELMRRRMAGERVDAPVGH